MKSILKYQPFKFLYFTFATVRLVTVLLPLWTVRNLFPSWRPRASWPLSWCLKNEFTIYMLRTLNTVGVNMSNPPGLDTKPGILGLHIDALTPNYIKGNLKEWADAGSVTPTRIPGYWMHGPNNKNMSMGEKPSLGEKVLLFLHGGGYVALSAHPTSPIAVIPRSILQQCAQSNANLNVKRALCVEYRLSSHDPNPRENPFPAALLDALDALAGYVYLVNIVGVAPKDVIVVGDSAGGNLVLAMIRYLVEQGDGISLAPPGAMLILSPWSDIGRSNSEDMRNSMHTHNRSDYLAAPVILPDGRAKPEYFQYAFAGAHGLAFLDTNVFISPASLLLKDEDVNFAGFPPAFVACGGGERFYDQIQTLTRRMRKDMGDSVVYYEAKDAVHDFMWLDWQDIPTKATLCAIEQWIEQL